MTRKQGNVFDSNNNNNNSGNFCNEKLVGASCLALDATLSDQAIMCDRNNDTRRADVSGSMLSVGEVSKKCRTTPAEVVADATDATGASQRAAATPLTTSNDWHLLDADGQSVAASSTSSSCNELNTIHELAVPNDRRCKRSMVEHEKVSNSSGRMGPSNGLKRSSQEESKGERAEEESELSPTLIYTCTLLYALMPVASFIAFLALLCLIFTKYWFITACYYAYLFFDRNSCNRGGRRFDAVYKSKFWTYLAAHFPIKLKYSDQFRLDPQENYILNYHPHGIAAFGCVTAFATNGLNFAQLFPGIKSHFMVHETSFLVPIMRETFSLRGDCSVNSKSFDYILSKKWKRKTKERSQEAGHLLALCGGGLAEADLSDAGTLKIVVATRKGFVKKALIHGANLIPCIAFGENSVFTKINLEPNSLLHRLESRFYSLFKFKHPIYYGASALGSEQLHGVLPYKRPITVVMGDPIRVERVEEPSQEQIDLLHAKYMEALHSIYASNKNLCTKYDTKIELV